MGWVTDSRFETGREYAAMQKRFISDTSHQMRTPLAVMKTGVEVALMQKDALTREEAIDVLESNLQEIEHITAMMNTLLLLSRLDDPAAARSIAPVNVSEIVRDTLARYKHDADAKYITLHFPPAISYVVQGEISELETLFRSIIKNAIAYTTSGGEVRVSITESNGRVIVTFADTGVGIAREKLIHIFEPFYRGEIDGVNARAQEKPLGLGLTLAKKIAERHLGSITVESEPCCGSTFAVALPLA